MSEGMCQLLWRAFAFEFYSDRLAPFVTKLTTCLIPLEKKKENVLAKRGQEKDTK